jgi:hypothetical protein
MWNDSLDLCARGGLYLEEIGEGGHNPAFDIGNWGWGNQCVRPSGPPPYRVGFAAGGNEPCTPRIEIGKPEVAGRLAPQVVGRVLRRHHNLWRRCYEEGLPRYPNLEGRVVLNFVIGQDGAVTNVSNNGSNLPDSATVGCMIRGLYGMIFPTPEAGVAHAKAVLFCSPE